MPIGDDRHVGRQAAAVVELDRLHAPVADEPRRRDFKQHVDIFGLEGSLEHRRGARVELALHQPIHEMDERHFGTGLGQAVCGLDAQQAAADHDDTRAAAGRPGNRRHISDIAESPHAAQIGPGNRQADGPRAGRKHELGESQHLAVGKRHSPRGDIDRGRRRAVAQGDPMIAPPACRF